ncbi:hypothetical protein EJB05_24705, partial [Eragrostis curvula]
MRAWGSGGGWREAKRVGRRGRWGADEGADTRGVKRPRRALAPRKKRICPDKLVLNNPSIPKFPNSPMLYGIAPDTKVSPTPRNWRPTRLLMLEGMLPEIPVTSKLRPCSVVERFTTEVGISPVKPALLLSSSIWSWLQFQSKR